MAFLVPLLCLSLFAQASHFRYGSITYQTGGASNRVVQFKVSEAWLQSERGLARRFVRHSADAGPGRAG